MYRQRAVDDGAEPAVIARERGDVGNLEGGVGQAPFFGLAPSRVNRGGGQVQPERAVSSRSQRQGDGRFPASHVEDVAVELALLDERRQLRLGRPDAPRRADALAELGGLSAVSRFESKISRFSHTFRYIKRPDICQ